MRSRRSIRCDLRSESRETGTRRNNKYLSMFLRLPRDERTEDTSRRKKQEEWLGSWKQSDEMLLEEVGQRYLIYPDGYGTHFLSPKGAWPTLPRPKIRPSLDHSDSYY